MSAAGRVVGIAQAEIGYLEKSLRNWDLYGINCLYDKTRYAGADNVTKYGFETGHSAISSIGWAPWCMSFVVWVLMAAFGKEKADKLLCGKYKSASTMDTKDAMIKGGRQVSLSKAKPGDIVFRSRSGGGHVGIVKGWQDGKIVTIEGNTAADDATAWNGGCVAQHIGGSWKWCCRPDWSLVEEPVAWHWVKSGADWFYQDADGRNTYGWKLIQETAGTKKHWYYFDGVGKMCRGIVMYKDKYYYLQPTGALEGACCKTDDEGALHIWDVEE